MESSQRRLTWYVTTSFVVIASLTFSFLSQNCLPANIIITESMFPYSGRLELLAGKYSLEELPHTPE